MIIANPLYDSAFKSLISDEIVAKAVIGALLETEVLEVDVQPTEYVKLPEKDDNFPRTIRLDYCVTIKNKAGETKKVLIEIQKASGAKAVYRFRQYLAMAGYRPKSTKEQQLPIITIYFLGFELKNIPTSCLHVSRQYVDMHDKKVIKAKEQFVELLTHDSYIIQIPRIKTGLSLTSKLETVLSVFELENFEKNYTDVTLNYNFPIKEKFQKKMVDILHYIGTDPESRSVLDNEKYFMEEEELTAGEVLRKDKEILEIKKELKKNKDIIIDTVKALKQDGMSAEKISEITKLSIDEVKKI